MRKGLIKGTMGSENYSASGWRQAYSSLGVKQGHSLAT